MSMVKRAVCAALAAGFSLSLAACNKEETKPSKDLDQSTKDKISSIAKDPGTLLTGTLENKTVKWMGSWDINPDSTGKNVPVELELFKQYYGGNIESTIVDFDSRYDKLATAILGGEGIDFFSASDMDAFPKGAIKDMFAPVDDYINYDTELWKDVKDVNDSFIWNGKHYIVCTNVTGDNCVVIYNKKTIDEAGFEDPAKLLEEGKWDWNTFEKMLKEFSDSENGTYGLDGWWCESALSKTTGVPYIGLKDGKLVNNLKDPNLERVQTFMKSLHDSGCVLNKGDFSWKEKPEFIGEGKELFYPCGLWTLWKTKDQWSKTFGEDVFFVPMPKDPQASKYYVPAGLDGYLMVKGGKNPEGFAKFADCKRYAVLNKDANDIGIKQLRDYGWTDEMIAMKDKMTQIAAEAPVYDFYTGVSEDVKTILDSAENGIRGSLNAGSSWNELVSASNDTIDSLIKEFNDNQSQSAAN